MLAPFETRLAAVLGASLPAPFAGRVTVAPLTPNGAGPVLQVAVRSARRIEPDIGSFRREQPPGLPTQRRVARLTVDMSIRLTPTAAAGRAQTVAGVDRLLYLLEDGSLRSGAALVQAGDQGFLLQELGIAGATVPDDDGAATVDLTATGWFWPVGEAGQDGITIGEVQIRQFALPVTLQAPRLLAGGGAVDLSLSFGRSGILQVQADAAATLPFGQMLVELLAADGSPGAGTLGGGAGGGPQSQLLDVAAGPVAFTYTPPAAPGLDILVLRVVQADGAAGMEIARFDLLTGSGP